MPILNSIAHLAAKPLPKTISPRAHAIFDYITVGSFLISAAWFWRRNKRASIAALICGGAELILNVLTNYPGGLKKAIPFSTHRKMDVGLAAMIATMPELLAFQDEDEKRYFLFQGATTTLVGQLTRIPDKTKRKERKYAA